MNGNPWSQLLGAGMALPLLSAAVGEVPFRHVVIDPTGPPDPWVKIVADVTGDGFPDVIIGGRSGPLVCYAWPEWKKSIIAAGGYATVSGTAVDVDGDGDLDLVLGGVVWFENPLPHGDPTAGPWKAHRIGEHRSHDALAADLDGDGKLEIVAGEHDPFWPYRSQCRLYAYKKAGAEGRSWYR
ncbi:MAG: FG-GAP-like repeat-containing protein, partial [Armatimonadota bacterium]|nr:FG-GAP-like repeat-containing protein [Armatimonadota bacterium]